MYRYFSSSKPSKCCILLGFFSFFRYLYWIDCCEYPHIGRVGMDGSSQTVVIETQISRPMALTIDYVNHRLYWADENHIEFSDMDGSHRHKGWSDCNCFLLVW